MTRRSSFWTLSLSIVLSAFLISACASGGIFKHGWLVDSEIDRLRKGMTEQQVVQVAGRPVEKNVTQTPRGRREQWVYERALTGHERAYLYFQDGQLTSWQYSN